MAGIQVPVPQVVKPDSVAGTSTVQVVSTAVLATPDANALPGFARLVSRFPNLAAEVTYMLRLDDDDDELQSATA